MTPTPEGAADTAPSPTATVGARIRVTAIGIPEDEPGLYVGAEGTVTWVYPTALAVEWDDAELERDNVGLVTGGSHPDRWEVLPDADHG